LAYPWNVRDNTAIPSNDWKTLLPLSDNHIDVLTYLGFDPAMFANGFEDELQIWNWFISSPFFDIRIFERSIAQLAEGDIACEKANMRGAYCRFLRWISENASEKYRCAELPNPVVYFKKEEAVLHMVDFHRRQALRKEKFSGRLVVEAGIEKRNIGVVLEYLKLYFKRTMIDSGDTGITCMDAWVESTDSEDIKRWTFGAIECWRIDTGLR
jgi:hypothetical protein